MKHKNKLIFGIVGFLFFSILFLGLFHQYSQPEKVVDCYDRYHNKIINQTCLDEKTTIGMFSSGVLVAFIFWILLIFFGGIIDDFEDRSRKRFY